MAHRGQGVGGLAGLRDEQAHLALDQRRVAVAELAGDVPVHRQARQLLEPVLADQAGIGRGAAGDRGQARNGGEVERQRRQADPVRGGIGERAQRIAQHRSLLEDLLLHEVAMVALADQGAAHRRLADLALDRPPQAIHDDGTLPVEEGDVALLEILDALGQGCQRQGVRAHEHLAVAVAQRQRAAFAGDHQQLLLTLEQERQREGPFQPTHGHCGSFARGQPLPDQRAHQVSHHLGVGLGGEGMAVRHQLGPQAQEVLDDAVVHQRHAVADMGVRIGLVRHAVGCPAGVADAGDAAQGLLLQALGQVDELARGPPAFHAPRHQGGDPGAVVAAILQASQRIQQQRRRGAASDHADDATHDAPNSRPVRQYEIVARTSVALHQKPAPAQPG